MLIFLQASLRVGNSKASISLINVESVTIGLVSVGLGFIGIFLKMIILPIVDYNGMLFYAKN